MGNVDFRNEWFPRFQNYVTADNRTFAIPLEMQFNDAHVLSIAIHSVLMVISAVGNISILVILVRRTRLHRSRINTLLIHLAIADLLVTFTLMPIDIYWSSTVSWWAGDTACRIAAFLKLLGVYQSCFILVSIGLDRYYAVLKPMQLSAANRRGKIILAFSWALSISCSLPQMFFFHVVRHPNITTFEQCITVNSFPSLAHELTYSFFGMVSMYILPLIIIIYCYGSILSEICRRSRETLINDNLRRTNMEFFSRARIRTLKMTVIIILAFFISWTPYYVMAFWYWVDKESAQKVDMRIQKGLFLFASTNSSVNPIVYGAFNIRSKSVVQARTRGSNTCTTEVRLQQVGHS